MRDLLERGAEARRQHLEVVAGRLGRGVEAGIGHHHRAGEIVGERHAQQPAGDDVLRLELRADRVDELAVLRDRELVGDLEGPARRVHDLGDQQLTPMQVVPAQPLAHHVDRQHADADAVARAQPLGHGVERLRPFQREVGREGLREVVDLGEMVALLLQDRADALDRRIAGQALGAVGVGVDEHARLAWPRAPRRRRGRAAASPR